MNKHDLEEGLTFTPRYNDDGLIPCITTCADTNEVLMFAFMNQESLNNTIDTREAHYWSRSRKTLWHKGATSGFTQKIVDIRTDCDQDCILLKVIVSKDSDAEGTCHTGRKTCFYRSVEDVSKLKLID